MKSYPFYQRFVHLQKMFLVGHVSVPNNRPTWSFAAHRPPEAIMAEAHEFTPANIRTDALNYRRVQSPLEDMTMYVADVELLPI